VRESECEAATSVERMCAKKSGYAKKIHAHLLKCMAITAYSRSFPQTVGYAGCEYCCGRSKDDHVVNIPTHPTLHAHSKDRVSNLIFISTFTKRIIRPKNITSVDCLRLNNAHTQNQVSNVLVPLGPFSRNCSLHYSLHPLSIVVG
jgi:hypothetical protein